MDNKLQVLSEILLELRNASANSTIDTIKSTMKKYNMLFLGKDFNSIYSVELLHSLKTIFNFEITKDELNNLIPIACKSLNMKIQPMIEVSNPDKNSIDCYQISLW